jgi:hypothetical protein
MTRCRIVNALIVGALLVLAGCDSGPPGDAAPSPEVTASPLPTPTVETPETPETASPSPTAARDTAPAGPLVRVSDQPAEGSVTVSEVSVAAAGFVVIHRDESGVPGAVLGHTPVEAGTTTDVVVMLDEPVAAGDVLWAMLHTDEGASGTYEFPGADVPVRDEDDAVVATPFEIEE